jgi:hypothetical protein
MTQGNQLTIQNRTTEITNELNEDVCLLSDQLVPAALLTARLDVAGAQTGAQLGVEPLIGALPALLNTVTLLGPELPEGRLLVVSAEGASTGGGTTAAIAGSRDVAVESRVLIEVAVVHIGVAVTVTVFDIGSIGDPPLRHCCCCFGSQSLRNPTI